MTYIIIFDIMLLGDAMKKILLLFICLLFITGCGTKVYDYRVEDWEMEATESSDKQDRIVDEIIDVWEDNNEKYTVNMEVNITNVKRNINIFIEENPDTEKTIFEIACEIVGVDYNKYK